MCQVAKGCRKYGVDKIFMVCNELPLEGSLCRATASSIEINKGNMKMRGELRRPVVGGGLLG